MSKKEVDMNKDVADWICTLRLDEIEGYGEKRHVYLNQYGHPDVSGAMCGFRIEIEGKLGDNKPTKIQEKRLRQWKATGAITGVYWSLEQAQQIVFDGLAERGVEVWRIKSTSKKH